MLAAALHKVALTGNSPGLLGQESGQPAAVSSAGDGPLIHKKPGQSSRITAPENSPPPKATHYMDSCIEHS